MARWKVFTETPVGVVEARSKAAAQLLAEEQFGPGVTRVQSVISIDAGSRERVRQGTKGGS